MNSLGTQLSALSPEVALTLAIAAYAAAVSTFAILWNVYRGLQDRPKLEFTGLVGITLPSRERTQLCFCITNVGKRPVMPKLVTGREKWYSFKKHVVVLTPELPKMLKEAEYCLLVYDRFDVIEANPYSLFVIDSAGRRYRMRRRILNKIKSDYHDYLRENAKTDEMG
jgi:hypothetical protein